MAMDWCFRRRASAGLLAAVLAGGLGGCATTGNPRDPLEGMNRAVFAFNEGLDKAVIKPAAEAYQTAVPLPGRVGVANFFANVGDLLVGTNNLLQGKPGEAVTDFARVAVNTTVGILGLFDVASELGLERHEEDFGQTLGRWGVPDGPYLVLPFFGSRTLRDTAGLVVDSVYDPVYDVQNVATRNILTGTRIVDARAQLLAAQDVLETAALDRYAYLRDAYLQRRRSLIYDGAPPRIREDDAWREPQAQSLSGLEDPLRAATEPILVGAADVVVPAAEPAAIAAASPEAGSGEAMPVRATVPAAVDHDAPDRQGTH